MSVVSSDRRTDDGADVRTRIDQFLIERGLTGARVVPLTGDASDRRYFRVILGTMDASPGGASGRNRLRADGVRQGGEALQPAARPVPAILSFSDELGIIGLEDLGDVTLQAHLVPPLPRAQSFVSPGFSLIGALPQRGAGMESSDYPPYGIAFDVAKLTWS